MCQKDSSNLTHTVCFDVSIYCPIGELDVTNERMTHPLKLDTFFHTHDARIIMHDASQIRTTHRVDLAWTIHTSWLSASSHYAILSHNRIVSKSCDFSAPLSPKCKLFTLCDSIMPGWCVFLTVMRQLSVTYTHTHTHTHTHYIQKLHGFGFCLNNLRQDAVQFFMA